MTVEAIDAIDAEDLPDPETAMTPATAAAVRGSGYMLSRTGAFGENERRMNS
jgi:hypothetical protein